MDANTFKPFSQLKRMMLIINPVSGRRISLRFLPDIIRIFTANDYVVSVFPTGVCLATDGSSSVTSGDGRNTVRISYSSLAADGFWDINISKGDRVVIYAQTRKEDGRPS